MVFSKTVHVHHSLQIVIVIEQKKTCITFFFQPTGVSEDIIVKVQ